MPHIRLTIFRTNTIITNQFFFSSAIMQSHSGCLFRVHFDSIAKSRERRTDFCIVSCVSFHFFLFFRFHSNQHSFVFDHVARRYIMQSARYTRVKTNEHGETTNDQLNNERKIRNGGADDKFDAIDDEYFETYPKMYWILNEFQEFHSTKFT